MPPACAARNTRPGERGTHACLFLPRQKKPPSRRHRVQQDGAAGRMNAGGRLALGMARRAGARGRGGGGDRRSEWEAGYAASERLAGKRAGGGGGGVGGSCGCNGPRRPRRAPPPPASHPRWVAVGRTHTPAMAVGRGYIFRCGAQAAGGGREEAPCQQPLRRRHAQPRGLVSTQGAGRCSQRRRRPRTSTTQSHEREISKQQIQVLSSWSQSPRHIQDLIVWG